MDFLIIWTQSFKYFVRYIHLRIYSLRESDAVVKLYPWGVHEEGELASTVLIIKIQQEVCIFFYCWGAVKEYLVLENINL